MASEVDLAQIGRVNVDVWRQTYTGLFSNEFLDRLSYEKSTARFSHMISNANQPSFLMVAEVAESVVGYAHAGASRERSLAPDVDGELYGLYLMPAYHGQGVGKALVAAAMTELKQRGFHSAVVVVFTENAHARAVYQALGAVPRVERRVNIGGESVSEWLYVWETLSEQLMLDLPLRQLTTELGVSPERAQKELVKAQFSRTANAYVKSVSHGNRTALAKVVSTLDPSADWTVLDVATGGGHVARALAQAVQHVVASDLTPEMLSAARKHIRDDAGLHNVSYVVGDAEALPFLDETFDAVTCRIAPHHFVHPQRFVTEAVRVLKPGGRFLLIDNVVPEDEGLADWYNALERLRDPSHVRCMPPSQWKSWMEGAGLTIITEEPSWKTFEFETWARRMVTSEEQYGTVVAWLKSASSAAREFFDVTSEDGTDRSFKGLEWMALCEKQVS